VDESFSVPSVVNSLTTNDTNKHEQTKKFPPSFLHSQHINPAIPIQLFSCICKNLSPSPPPCPLWLISLNKISLPFPVAETSPLRVFWDKWDLWDLWDIISINLAQTFLSVFLYPSPPLCPLCKISFVSSVVNSSYYKGNKDLTQSSQCRGEKFFASNSSVFPV